MLVFLASKTQNQWNYIFLQMIVSGWNKNRNVPEGILNSFGNKLNEKYMQHGSPRCYTMRCAKIPSTVRKLPQKHRRLNYSMLPIPNWPGSIYFSNQKWLRHTNHNMTNNIHARPFCARCGPYSVRCAKTTATTLVFMQNLFYFALLHKNNQQKQK